MNNPKLLIQTIKKYKKSGSNRQNTKNKQINISSKISLNQIGSGEGGTSTHLASISWDREIAPSETPHQNTNCETPKTAVPEKS